MYLVLYWSCNFLKTSNPGQLLPLNSERLVPPTAAGYQISGRHKLVALVSFGTAHDGDAVEPVTLAPSTGRLARFDDYTWMTLSTSVFFNCQLSIAARILSETARPITHSICLIGSNSAFPSTFE